VQKGHQVFNLVRQQGILERGHTPATISYLSFDLTLIATLANVAKVWPKASTIAVGTMTMLTSSFMEKDGTRDFIAFLGGACIRRPWLQKAAHSQKRDAPGAHDSEDSREPSSPSRN
jgi:ABC-type Fe3+ transport system substrate-binding protein